jgi:hypothetical protein
MPLFVRLFLTAVLSAGLGAAAFAQAAPPLVVRGQVVSLAANTLTVKTATSTLTVAVPDNLRVTYLIKTDLSKIGPGTFIGTAAVPQSDGTFKALEVQLFDQQNHPGEADRPWDLAPRSTMTNAAIATMSDATVDAVQGRMLVLKLKDGEKKVFVPSTAPIVAYEPADRSAVTPGANIILFATKKDDGSLTTASVNIGKNGLQIPY